MVYGQHRDDWFQAVVKNHEPGTPAYQVKLFDGAQVDMKVKDALLDHPEHADQRTNRGERLA